MPCVCVCVPLVIQHAMHMSRMVCDHLAVPYFSTLSHKLHDFQKKKIYIYTVIPQLTSDPANEFFG